jgi:hypothetical protein
MWVQGYDQGIVAMPLQLLDSFGSGIPLSKHLAQELAWFDYRLQDGSHSHI